MRKINKTSLKVAEIYPLCYAHKDEKADKNIKIKYANILSQIIHQEEEYERYANSGQLDLFPYLDKKDIEPYGLTADDMTYLYTAGMVNEDWEGRQYYQKILNQTGLCPYCEINTPTNLDHVLEKTKSLGTTVTPINLVPSCPICNGDKKVCKEVLWHPYYDEAVDYIWLYAEYVGKMGDNNEPCVKFFVNIPYEHKDERMAKKIKDSFHYFKLFITFQGHAITILNRNEGEMLEGIELGRTDLDRRYLINDALERHKRSSERYDLNSCDAALYRCLIDNELYYQELCEKAAAKKQLP